MSDKYGFVYLWYDRKHKRYYIGCHWGNISDTYICSSRWMKNAYKRRPSDFTRKILSTGLPSKKVMFEEEYKWLSFIKPEEKGKRYYNVRILPPTHWSTCEKSHQSVTEKLRERTTALHQDPEFREKFLAGRQRMKGRKQTPESIEKRRTTMIETLAEKFPLDKRRPQPYKWGSEEHKLRVSEASKRSAANRTEEEKAEWSRNMSEKMKGVGKGKKKGPLSDEIKAKISSKLKGIPRPKEVVEKVSAAQKGRTPNDNQKAYYERVSKSVIIDGVKFVSYSEASREIGVNVQTIINRTKSSNFPNYLTGD